MPRQEVPHDKPELVLGVVGALGTDLDLVYQAFNNSMSEVGYRCRLIHLIELLHAIDRWERIPESPLDVRYNKHMDAGDDFREMIGRGDALDLLAVVNIRQQYRKAERGDPDGLIPSCAYVLKSLKHHDEVKTLRKIYGPGFLLAAAYSPWETRLQGLARRVADSYHVFQTNQFRAKAQSLIERDEGDPRKKFGQNVRETFWRADVFINTSDPAELQKSVSRFVELLFGYPFHTPTRDEYGMFHAHAAALRSASLSRQVGAVVSTENGDIIAVGTNEVPKAGGGLYWAGDIPDHVILRSLWTQAIR